MTPSKQPSTTAADAETEIASASKAFLTSWTNHTLEVPDPEENPLDLYAGYLSHLYGVPLETSFLIAASTVSAAAGACTLLRGPGRVSNVPALNLLFVCRSAPKLRLAAEDCFETLRPYARFLAMKQHELDEARFNAEKLKHQACIQKALSEEKRAEKVEKEKTDPNRIPPTSGSPEEYAKYWSTLIPGREEEMRKEEADGIRTAAKKLHENALNGISTLNFQKKPAFFVEGILPDDLTNALDLSADGSIFNLDLDGTTWSMLAASSSPRAMETSARVAAGWRGSPSVQENAITPAAAISSFALLGPDRFLDLWNNKGIRTSGIRSVILPSDPDYLGSQRSFANSSLVRAEAFHSRVKGILFQRMQSRSRELNLSSAAQRLYFEFLDELEDYIRIVPTQWNELLDKAGPHALRLALLLELGKGVSDEVSEASMKRACHLAGWCVSGTALHLARRQPSSSLHRDLYEEVRDLVNRVQIRGPISRRDLFRTYHDQRSSRLGPVLDTAISQGLLRIREDSSIEVADS